MGYQVSEMTPTATEMAVNRLVKTQNNNTLVMIVVIFLAIQNTKNVM